MNIEVASRLPHLKEIVIVSASENNVLKKQKLVDNTTIIGFTVPLTFVKQNSICFPFLWILQLIHHLVLVNFSQM